jgi:autotransporter-associated beta strand protein
MKTSSKPPRSIIPKTKCFALASLAVTVALCIPVTSSAQTDVFKANNTDALNLTTSWSSVAVPGTNDVAVWNNTVTGANSTVLGANNLSFGGIKIVNPGGAITIGTNASGTNFSLGTLGVDMSAATQNLTISAVTTLTADQTFNVATNRILQFNNRIDGNRHLTKKGDGALNLSGSGAVASNSFSKITIDGGRLRGGNSGYAFGNGSALDLIKGELSFFTASSSAGNYGHNSLNVLGDFTINNVNSGGTAATYFQFGSLAISNKSLTLTAAGTTNDAAFSFVGATTLNGNAVFNVSSRSNNALHLLGGISDGGAGHGLTKDGVGTLRVTAASTYTGDTVISNGVLEIVNVAGGQTLSGTNSNLAYTISMASTEGLSVGQSVSAASGVPSGTVILSIDSATQITVSGPLSAATSGRSYTFGSTTGSLAGSTLDYNNYGGTVSFGYSTNVALGGLKGGQNLGLANASNNAVALNVGGNNQSTTYTGAMSGTGSLTKTGTGTFTLTGTNTYAGATTVSNGTLVVDGAIAGDLTVDSGATLGGSGTIGGEATIAGNLNPGNSPGLLTFSNNLTLALSATTTMEIQGTARGDEYDAVNVTGNLTYGGALVLDFSNPFNQGSYTFDLFSATGGYSDNFVSVSLAGAYSGNFSYDLATTSWNYESAEGDQWTFYQETGTLAFDAVPEPSTYALLVLAGVGLAGHVIRRRYRRV